MDLFQQTKPQPAATSGGDVVACDRCKVPLRFSGQTPNPKARIIRHATTPQGVCATCAFRAWLNGDYGGAIEEIIERDCQQHGGAEVLKMPHIQDMIRNLMVIGQCDAPFEELDFDRLVREWDLPIPGGQKKKGRRGR